MSWLGSEIADNWPLICEIYSDRAGVSGAPLFESGGASNSIHVQDDNGGSKVQASGHDSDTVSSGEAREQAKRRAKVKLCAKSVGQHTPKHGKSPRGVEGINDTLRDGFNTFADVMRQRSSSSSADPSMMNAVEGLQYEIRDLTSEMKDSLKKTNDAITQSLIQTQQSIDQNQAVFSELLSFLKSNK